MNEQIHTQILMLHIAYTELGASVPEKLTLSKDSADKLRHEIVDSFGDPDEDGFIGVGFGFKIYQRD